MGDKVSLKISPAVASCTREGVPQATKLQAVNGDLELKASDRGMALVILSQDHDPEVKGAAIRKLREMALDLAIEMASDPDTHPRILDIVARLHGGRPDVMKALLNHPGVNEATRVLLVGKTASPADPVATEESLPQEDIPPQDDGLQENELEDECAEEAEEINEEDPEFQSKYQLMQTLGVGEKIKIALTGDKEWRSLLIKDSNKLVSGAVVKNPRITEAEVLGICKSVIQNDEIVRTIYMNKEWIKNYQIRKALALNSKTPLPQALRFVASLTEKDLAAIAKSKNVSSVISTQARRILSTKKR
jgi:hypothetical protein